MRLIRELREEIARLRALLGGDMVSFHNSLVFVCLVTFVLVFWCVPKCIVSKPWFGFSTLVTYLTAPNLPVCSWGKGAEYRCQHQGMDRPGVRQVPEGGGEQGKMEKTGCGIICGAPMTLAVKGLTMMMMMMMHVYAQTHAWHTQICM